jgi:5-methylcytosine-specific restriction endonuclease McrA
MREMTLDHQVPASLGGRATRDNLRAAHRRCNNERADMPAEWFEER